MKKNAFIANAAILTVTSILLRISGIYIMSYLTQKVGPEGVGLFQLIFSVYSLAAAFAVSGISVAVTRLVAENSVKSSFAAAAVVKKSVGLALVVSISVAVVFFCLADFVGVRVLGEPRSVMALRVLSPSLPFMAVSACLRGYLVGRGKILKTASSSIFEQAVQIAVVMSAIGYFLPKGLEAVSVCVMLAALGSEVLGCLYLFILYKTDRGKGAGRQKGVVKQILGITMPIAAGIYLRSSLRTAESVLLPSSLERYGMPGPEALSRYGVITGMCMPLLYFPSVLLFSISTLLVPEIARYSAAGQAGRVQNAAGRVIRMTLLLALFCCAVFLLFSGSLSQAIYRSGEAGRVLAVLAPLVPLIYLDIVVDAMLNGLNQQVYTMKYSVADSLVRVTLIFLLVPVFGLPGFFMAVFSSTILNSLLSLRRLMRVSRVRLRVFEWVVKPALAAGAAGSCALLLFRFFAPGLAEGWTAAAQIAAAALLYAGFLVWARCVTPEDIEWFRGRIAPGAAKKRMKGAQRTV